MGWKALSITERRAVVAVDMEVEKHEEVAGRLEVEAALFDADGRQVPVMHTGKNGAYVGQLKMRLEKE